MPNPRVPDDRVTDPERLVQMAPDLTDQEVGEVGKVGALLTSKYSKMRNTKENLDQFRDEATYKFAEIGFVVEVDPTPCFYGESPDVIIIGHLKDNPIYKEGFDHERKRWEVNKANERNEAFKGQKEPYNARKDSK